MIDYFMPYGEHFEYYDDITEEEANELISSESYINREDLDKYESEACIKILDHMFLLSDQIEVPKDIETIKSFDHTKKND